MIALGAESHMPEKGERATTACEECCCRQRTNANGGHILRRTLDGCQTNALLTNSRDERPLRVVTLDVTSEKMVLIL
jgi:hypothetical protein